MSNRDAFREARDAEMFDPEPDPTEPTESEAQILAEWRGEEIATEDSQQHTDPEWDEGAEDVF